MSMTESPTAAKPKRKYVRRAKPAGKTSESIGLVATPNEFAGMTATDCCNACDETRCVITGINVCGHPHKGGLQAAQMMQRDVVQRYNRAKRALGTPHA